jgi:hypothetical protein
MKYVVTAISRLTQQRVRITSPHSRWKAEMLLLQAKQKYKARTKDRPYMRLRLEEAVEELSVF